MSAYRHLKHAGNFGDVLKHIVLLELLQAMVADEAGFLYVDTHSGAGLYRLFPDRTGKRQGYLDGVARLLQLDWPELAPYRAALASYNDGGRLRIYPGSPLLAARCLRRRDRSRLHELQVDEFERLRQNLAAHGNCLACHGDGLDGLLAALPPADGRVLALLDPAYQESVEYELAVDTLRAAHGAFPQGTYALWYPVIERERVERMQRQLVAAGIRTIQVFELGLTADDSGSGMTAAGMLVINPPAQLMGKMQTLLPRLAQVLGEKEQAFARCLQLA